MLIWEIFNNSMDYVRTKDQTVQTNELPEPKPDRSSNLSSTQVQDKSTFTYKKESAANTAESSMSSNGIGGSSSKRNSLVQFKRVDSTLNSSEFGILNLY